MSTARKTVFSALILCFVSFSFLNARESKPELTTSQSSQAKISSLISRDLSLGRDLLFTSSADDTYVLAEYSFNGYGGGCDVMGWFGVDMTVAPGLYFHIDDFAGLGGGDFGRLTPLVGAQSLWCGTRADSLSEYLCSYTDMPGYGDNWNQTFTSVAFPCSGDAAVAYLVRWDSEIGYDYTYVEYVDTSGSWVELASYTDIGEAQENWIIPQGVLPDTLKLRFRFKSDGAWSDEDGQINTDGAVIVDSLRLADTTGVMDFQDFEAEPVGAKMTADGDWQATNIPGYGDYAGLISASQLPQDDPCHQNLSCLWTFLIGSTYTYDCGGYPNTPAVPFGNDRDQFIDNEIWSPWIEWDEDIHGSPVPGTASRAFFTFDWYRDLPLENNVFLKWHQYIIILN